MNELTTLITAIGDFFTNSDWAQIVKWPFWSLLFTVAVGGVYCARFGKNTLINQSICGTIKLIVIYMAAAACYIIFPPLRNMLSKLPFLSVSDTAVTLDDPLGLLDRGLSVLSPLMLRLMMLIFALNLTDMLGSGGKTLLTWVCSQVATAAIALGFYTVVTAGITKIVPSLLTRYAIIPVALVIGIGVLMFCAKIIFTVVVSGGNPYFSAVYKFFTVNKGGSLFTISTLTFLMSVILLVWLNFIDHARVEYSSFSRTGYGIILILCFAALFIFSRYYTDRKKG